MPCLNCIIYDDGGNTSRKFNKKNFWFIAC